MATQVFTLNAQGEITSSSSSITVNKGDTVTFELQNDSGYELDDWGLYFNNPFSYNQNMRYSFGNSQHNGNTFTAQQQVCQDTASYKVAKYNAYAIYAVIKTHDGMQHLYQRDPEIIVNNGDIEN